VDVVARLEIGGDRRFVVRLGDAAEDVIAHESAAEREVPRADHRRRRWRLGLDRHIRRKSRTRNHCQRRCCQDDFLHDDPHHFPEPSQLPDAPRTDWLVNWLQSGTRRNCREAKNTSICRLFRRLRDSTKGCWTVLHSNNKFAGLKVLICPPTSENQSVRKARHESLFPRL